MDSKLFNPDFYYLSGTLSKYLDPHPFLGLLIQPDTRSMKRRVSEFEVWGADNGCFAKGPDFDLARYLDWLSSMAAFSGSCLFATAPDVVGDPRATVARSLPVLPTIRKLGYKAAMVAQDGFEFMLEADPSLWDRFDVLFLGGTTDWKIGTDPSEAWIRMFEEAHSRDKWVHMGRVNSQKRVTIASRGLGCSSGDGNFLKYDPRSQAPLAWVTTANLSDDMAGRDLGTTAAAALRERRAA